MATFFNIEAIKKEANGDTKRFLEIFKWVVKGHPLAPTSSLKNINISNFRKGTSFILNARALLNTNNLDADHVVQYILLASLRDYYMYKQYRVTYLDCSFFPDLNMGMIKHNPLISITNNKIYFKYED